MKKTMLSALLVSTLASASAMAAVPLYTQGDSSVELYGRMGAYLDKTRDSRFDLKDDGSRLGLTVKHGFAGDWKALGGFELRFADMDNKFSDPKTHDAYIGLQYAPLGTLTFGRQATTADDLALSKFAYQHENITLLPTHGDRVVKFRSADYNGFSLGADYTFIGSSSKDDPRSSSTGVGLFYENQFGDVGFKLNGGYANTKIAKKIVGSTSGEYSETTKAWLVGTQLSYQKLTLGVDYSQSKLSPKGIVDPEDVKVNAFQVALKYQLQPETSIFTAYQQKKVELGGDTDKAQQYTIGLDHQLHKNVLMYAQLDTTKATDFTGDKKNEVGGAVGMRVFF